MVVFFSRISELGNNAHKLNMNNILTCHIGLLYGKKNDPNNEIEDTWVYFMVNIYFYEYISNIYVMAMIQSPVYYIESY